MVDSARCVRHGMNVLYSIGGSAYELELPRFPGRFSAWVTIDEYGTVYFGVD